MQGRECIPLFRIELDAPIRRTVPKTLRFSEGPNASILPTTTPPPNIGHRYLCRVMHAPNRKWCVDDPGKRLCCPNTNPLGWNVQFGTYPMN